MLRSTSAMNFSSGRPLGMLERVTLPLLLSPARHASREKAAEIAYPDRHRQLRCTPRVIVVATDQDDLLSEVGHPGKLRTEACTQYRDAYGAWNVRFVELEICAHVDGQRTLHALQLELPRSERHHLDSGDLERTPVQIHDRLEIRRLWRKVRRGPLDEASLVGFRKQLVVPELVADRRGGLEVHLRSSAERAAEVAGPDLGLGRESRELLEAAEDVPRSLLPRHGQVRARNRPHEDGVAGEDRPRLLPARVVDQGKCCV